MVWVIIRRRGVSSESRRSSCSSCPSHGYYLIRFWRGSVGNFYFGKFALKISDVFFQGQTLFWPYLRNGWSDWCKTKRKCISWILAIRHNSIVMMYWYWAQYVTLTFRMGFYKYDEYCLYMCMFLSVLLKLLLNLYFDEYGLKSYLLFHLDQYKAHKCHKWPFFTINYTYFYDKYFQLQCQ